MQSSLATKVLGLKCAKGLSTTNLAKSVLIERSYLHQIEHGKASNPGLRVLQGLSKALDVSVDYLVDDETEENRSWGKVAADESLEVFCKRRALSPEEMAGLVRVSMTSDAPRTLDGWKRFWRNLQTYTPVSNPRQVRKRRSAQSSDISSE